MSRSASLSRPAAGSGRAMLRSVACTALLGTTALASAAQDRFADVTVESQQVRDNIHMLTGRGGNIGVSVGEDGTLIIDDQFLPLAERIVAAVEELGGASPRLVLNTHFHGDHTGGNPHFGKSGTIVAHDNVRNRLSQQPDFPPAGLPVLTFEDRVRVHFNGDTVEVIHLPTGHTDGDSIVWFEEDKVLHTGDLLFNGAFPFIDTASGGSVAGYVENLSTILDMVSDGDVRIIPGHGPLATRQEVEQALDMIRQTRATVTDALDSGKTVDEVVEQGLDPRWSSWGEGFIDEERWIRILAADHDAAASGAATSADGNSGDR